MALQPVRGTHDLLPEECAKHRWIVGQALSLAERYGFEEIATPIFEFSDVFKRTLGESSDIVNKEMYTFEDKGGESLTLRPEGTASVARAFISNGLAQNLPLKFFYQGPMFRYERPQKGRQRQFHQFGVELLGVDSFHADLECMALAWQVLKSLNLSVDLRMEVNSIGDTESRSRYRQALVEYLNRFQKDLSEDSQRRLATNPLRILDSKDEHDKKIIEGVPALQQYFNAESQKFYEDLKEGLLDLAIPFVENPLLVRGLDYYSHCVFEVRAEGLGSQDTVLAGGRYDGLISQMGGPSTPGVGWASGLERLSLLLAQAPAKPRPVALIPLGEVAEAAVRKLSFQLRNQGFHIELAYSGNLSKRMKKANKANAKVAVILGSDELSKGAATWKDLDSGAQQEVKLSDLPELLKEII